MNQIELSRREGRVDLKIQAQHGGAATFELSLEEAQKLAIALLDCGFAVAPSGSLFEVAQVLSTDNPRIEVKASDTGKINLAYLPLRFRPFLIHLDQERARGLRDALSDALDLRG